ncbi:hypothetical protein [Sulfurovum sp.]|uniref:hypothetical protein n=1 Tax=Sulfurovum sp. TaxID=1969726 RepID=UPI0035691FAD
MINVSMKVILSLVFVMAIQGCGGLKTLTAMSDSEYKQYNDEILEKLEQCHKSDKGMDINKYLKKRKAIQRTYERYVIDEEYNETDKTYGDLKEECQTKYNNEQLRLEKIKAQKLQEEKETAAKVLKDNEDLAKKNGYKGYVEFVDMHQFIRLAEAGSISINDYKQYVIHFRDSGTYAYKFTQLAQGIEMYQPNYRYGVNSTLGIKRIKENKNQPLEGQLLNNIEYVSFIGVSTYKTVLGANKQIVLFDRAIDFKVALVQDILEELSDRLSQ